MHFFKESLMITFDFSNEFKILDILKILFGSFIFALLILTIYFVSL